MIIVIAFVEVIQFNRRATNTLYPHNEYHYSYSEFDDSFQQNCYYSELSLQQINILITKNIVIKI